MSTSCELLAVGVLMDRNLAQIRVDRRHVRATIHTVRYLEEQLTEALYLVSCRALMWYEDALAPLYQITTVVPSSPPPPPPLDLSYLLIFSSSLPLSLSLSLIYIAHSLSLLFL